MVGHKHRRIRQGFFAKKKVLQGTKEKEDI